MGRPKLDITKDKLCSICQEVKPASGFYQFKNGADRYGNEYIRLSSRCKDCEISRNKDYWQNMEPERRVEKARKRTLKSHGLTQEKYDELLAIRDGGCHICGVQSETHLYIDHDHACCPGNHGCSKCVRGLLCIKCNMAIGALLDDSDLLRASISYLERAR
jgi:hypothetical protein